MLFDDGWKGIRQLPSPASKDAFVVLTHVVRTWPSIMRRRSNRQGTPLETRHLPFLEIARTEEGPWIIDAYLFSLRSYSGWTRTIARIRKLYGYERDEGLLPHREDLIAIPGNPVNVSDGNGQLLKRLMYDKVIPTRMT